MAKTSDFQSVFESLRAIMKKHAAPLRVLKDKPGDYQLTGSYSEKWKKEIWFGGVRLGKAYASYHLMSVYMDPSLLKSMSKELKARMQGKSCFNFKRDDAALFKELDVLTKESVELFKKLGQASRRPRDVSAIDPFPLHP